MSRPAPDPLPPLSAFLGPGGTIEVEVTPRAGRARVVAEGGVLKVFVTEAPEKGRATEAVRAALARAFGLAKSDLELARGAASRRKVFRLRVG